MPANLDSSMLRCTTCGRWWGAAVQYADWKATCSCGGALAIANMDEHLATLPRAPYDPSKDKK